MLCSSFPVTLFPMVPFPDLYIHRFEFALFSKGLIGIHETLPSLYVGYMDSCQRAHSDGQSASLPWEGRFSLRENWRCTSYVVPVTGFRTWVTSDCCGHAISDGEQEPSTVGVPVRRM